MSESFTVPGVPQPKGSWVAFFSKKDRRCKVRPDNSKAATVWRDEIIAEARRAHVERIMTGPVAVDMVLYFPRPPGPEDRHAIYRPKRPDADKCARLALDALTGVAFYDDNQVAALRVVKLYTDDQARSEFRVWALAATEAPLLEGML